MANVTLMVNVIVMTTFLDLNANVSVTFKSIFKTSIQYLKHYFQRHVCLSIRCAFVRAFVRLSED